MHISPKSLLASGFLIAGIVLMALSYWSAPQKESIFEYQEVYQFPDETILEWRTRSCTPPVKCFIVEYKAQNHDGFHPLGKVFVPENPNDALFLYSDKTENQRRQYRIRALYEDGEFALSAVMQAMETS